MDLIGQKLPKITKKNTMNQISQQLTTTYHNYNGLTSSRIKRIKRIGIGQ